MRLIIGFIAFMSVALSSVVDVLALNEWEKYDMVMLIPVVVVNFFAVVYTAKECAVWGNKERTK